MKTIAVPSPGAPDCKPLFEMARSNKQCFTVNSLQASCTVRELAAKALGPHQWAESPISFVERDAEISLDQGLRWGMEIHGIVVIDPVQRHYLSLRSHYSAIARKGPWLEDSASVTGRDSEAA